MIETVYGLWKKGGLTVVLIEHDMEIVFRVSQYIHVLSYGKLLAEGNPEQIRNNPAVTLQPCDMRGKVREGAEVVHATAEVVVGGLANASVYGEAALAALAVDGAPPSYPAGVAGFAYLVLVAAAALALALLAGYAASLLRSRRALHAAAAAATAAEQQAPPRGLARARATAAAGDAAKTAAAAKTEAAAAVKAKAAEAADAAEQAAAAAAAAEERDWSHI
jgi:hypothetical protein